MNMMIEEIYGKIGGWVGMKIMGVDEIDFFFKVCIFIYFNIYINKTISSLF